MDEEEEEDTFVTIGTPLEPYEEDEIIKKPTRVQDQTAHDSKGRRRFHGAFTGGFSAGYFNTVGSEQGWVPSTFVSSRSKKSDTSVSRRPENFMDDEDLGEHGIAPRKVAPTEDFTSALKKRKLGQVVGDGIIPGASPLEDIIVPAKCPVGVRLLRKLGWKEGQGVGPRVKRKARRRLKQPAAASAQKVYGCCLPPENLDEEESDEDEYAEGITFAPKDVNPICFTPKDNLHGIGYHGIDPKTALLGGSGHVSLFEPAPVSCGRKKGITGQAFGIGAFEDEDDDIYSVDRMSNYDRELGGPEKDRLHGWTAPKHKRDATQLAIGNVTAVLQNFKLSSIKCQPKKIYPPPQLPRDFRPYHTPTTTPGVTLPVPPPVGRTLDANVRGLMLGEMPRMRPTGSVFDVLGTQKMEPPKLPPTQISFTPSSAPSTPAQVKTETPDLTGQSPLSRPSQPMDTAPPATTATSSTAAGFQPFARTPEKQARYEKYLDLRKQGKADTYEEYARKSLTEWESRQEAAEFGRAAQLYRPLSGSMATRFTKARFDDTVSSAELPEPEQGEVSAQQKAAEMKLFGKLTRETTKWRPDKLLCKRFNVQNPYPDEAAEMRKTKREKFSIFNFLSCPPPPESTTPTPGQQPVALAAIEPASNNRTETTNTASVKTESVTADPAVSAGETTTQPSDTTRPPMDLFKAIFGDSSNSDSSDSEMEPDTALPTPVPPLPDAIGVAEPVPPITANTTETSNGTIAIEPVAQRLEPTVDLTCVTTPDDDEKASLPFGPALPPPPQATQGTAKSCEKTSRKHSHKDKKHKHKSHHKKKKSRHKKHKKQHKKHRTKPDTGSESDAEDSGDSGDRVPSDTQLLDKLNVGKDCCPSWETENVD